MAPVSGGFGERIEEYEVLELLGKGGFAVVYRARCLRSQMEVAVKMIDKTLMGAAGMVGRVRQEVSIHSRLKHPSILELYTFFEDAHYVYLVLELARNGELARHFREGSGGMSEHAAAGILRQVVDGLLYLHYHRILHRDLSLNNLLLTHDMRVKIADFGLATQLAQPDEKHVTMCGTPNYISPEVASRSRHGLPADVWGVGCLLYTLLTGKPPFHTKHVTHTLNKVIHADYQMPAGLSADARDLIDRLLRKDPGGRPSLQQVAQHPFLQLHHSVDTTRDSGYQPSSVATTTTHSITPAHHRTRSEERLAKSANMDVLQHYKGELPRPASFNVLTGLVGGGAGSSTTEEEEEAVKVDREKGGRGRMSGDNKENTTTTGGIGVPPLCTMRLCEVTHQTRNARLCINAQGEVSVHFIRRKGRDREERVTEVCCISGDGMRVVVYNVDGGRGVNVTASLPPHTPAPHEIFSYHTLPPRHHKKYLYAARFVDLVKAKTPKISIYSSRAKCHLMENGTDLEGAFYQGGKVTISSSEGVKVVDPQGNTFHSSQGLNPTAQDMYQHLQQCASRLVEVERALQGLPEVCYPLTMGRRPTVTPSTTATALGTTSTPPMTGSINIGSFCHNTASLNQYKTMQNDTEVRSYTPSTNNNNPLLGGRQWTNNNFLMDGTRLPLQQMNFPNT